MVAIQYGVELPNGGMNELDSSSRSCGSTRRARAPDGRPVVNELQWIQFQLDSYATTAEAVAHAGEAGIRH